MSAPGLDLAGSYLSIQQHDDLLFESTEGDISLSAAHRFEVDSNLVTLIANEVQVNTPGAVEFTGQNAVLVNANGINIKTGKCTICADAHSYYPPIIFDKIKLLESKFI